MTRRDGTDTLARTEFAASAGDATLDETITIHVTDRDGHTHLLPAIEGWRVMEVIRDWGLPIRAECGGACACATCHVYVDRAWVDRLPAPTDEELDRLDDAPLVEANSRLACQILVRSDLDGLAVTLAPGSEPG